MLHLPPSRKFRNRLRLSAFTFRLLLKHYYLNRSFIDNMKNPFILINTSRVKVVSTVDLIDGLSSGKIRGAALDVLENEQFSLYTTKEKEVHEALMAF